MIVKPARRAFLHAAAGAAALPALARVASAQAYPARPVRLLVGFAAGGPSDISARLIGQWLSERLGQSFIIENRPGAGGNLATETVVRAPPDGYTLLETTSTNAWNTALYHNLTFDFSRDIAPVAGVCRYAGVIVVNPSVPATSVPELIAYAKANPGRINMGSGGAGTPSHLYGELFKKMTGIDLLHVPFRGGGPAVIALLAGQVQVFFGTVSAGARSDHPHAHGRAAGRRANRRFRARLRGKRLGIGAPRHTPVEIIDTLNSQINAALADAGFKSRLANLGVEAFAMSPGELGRFIADYTEKWGKLIRAAGIRAE